ncbi:MAG: hypothetical protein H6706_18885 [Myxococcales bacterium]|nr:hypothetical protein [Myxococcales bacterium]
MSETPDAPALLDALAGFLADQVQPAVTDPRLAFRVRVAAYLTGVLAREARLGPGHATAEAGRLAALLDRPAPPAGGPDLDAWLEAANADLAAHIRQAGASADVRAHLFATLRETLAINQPGFDLRLDVERPVD